MEVFEKLKYIHLIKLKKDLCNGEIYFD